MTLTEVAPTVPVLDLTPQDIDNLVDELRDYHAIYRPLFQRREQRDWAFSSLHGLLLPLERTSVEPIAIALHGPHDTQVRALQSVLNAGPWDDDCILRQHWQDVDMTLGTAALKWRYFGVGTRFCASAARPNAGNAALERRPLPILSTAFHGDPAKTSTPERGTADGVLLLDGSDFPKKGQESIGVQRQYCGELGTIANGQAGVFLGSAGDAGATLLDRRVYLPQPWVEDPAYTERRHRSGVPADVVFQTKPDLGLAMIREVVAAGTLHCR